MGEWLPVGTKRRACGEAGPGLSCNRSSRRQRSPCTPGPPLPAPGGGAGTGRPHAVRLQDDAGESRTAPSGKLERGSGRENGSGGGGEGGGRRSFFPPAFPPSPARPGLGGGFPSPSRVFLFFLFHAGINLLDGPAGAEPGPGGAAGPRQRRGVQGARGFSCAPLPGDKASPAGLLALLPRARRALRLAPAFFCFVLVFLFVWWVFFWLLFLMVKSS